MDNSVLSRGCIARAVWCRCAAAAGRAGVQLVVTSDNAGATVHLNWTAALSNVTGYTVYWCRRTLRYSCDCRVMAVVVGFLLTSSAASWRAAVERHRIHGLLVPTDSPVLHLRRQMLQHIRRTSIVARTNNAYDIIYFVAL